MDFASRLTNLERQFMQMKSNQYYKLGEAKVFRFRSQRMNATKYSSYLIPESWEIHFSYKFTPMNKNNTFMYAVLHVYDKNGNEASSSSVRKTLSGFGYSLSNYKIENDTLTIGSDDYRLSSVRTEPDISDKSLLPFSVELEIVSFSDGAFQVEQL